MDFPVKLRDTKEARKEWDNCEEIGLDWEPQKLDPEKKALWLAALRSGQFEQHTGALRDPGQPRFCCLGVANEISGLGQWEWNGDSFFIPSEDYLKPPEEERPGWRFVCDGDPEDGHYEPVNVENLVHEADSINFVRADTGLHPGVVAWLGAPDGVEDLQVRYHGKLIGLIFVNDRTTEGFEGIAKIIEEQL